MDFGLLVYSHAASGAGKHAKDSRRKLQTFYQRCCGKIAVEAFMLDEYAVTNADFLAFVKANPSWAPDKVKALFADSGYLSHWPEDYLENKSLESNMEPVINVSWFAANAYCKWKTSDCPPCTNGNTLHWPCP